MAVAGAGWFLTVFEWEQGGSLQADFEKMDPALWSGLPQEVLLEVVRKLPLRFLAVSKQWRHVLTRHDVFSKRRCVASLSQVPAGRGDLSPLAKLGVPMVRAHSFYLTLPADDLEFGASQDRVLCFFSLNDEGLLKLFLCYPLEGRWEALPGVELPGSLDQGPHIFMQDTDIFVVKLKHVLVYSRRQGCWMPIVEFQAIANMHSMVGQPLMCEGVIYQLGEADDLHLLDVTKLDYELVFDMEIEIDAFWLVEHNRAVYFLDRYDDRLDCRLICRGTEETEVISSAQKEEWQPYFDFLGEVGVEDNSGQVVSVFGYIILCASSPLGSHDSGYLLALDPSHNTWSSVATSRQEAMTISHLLAF